MMHTLLFYLMAVSVHPLVSKSSFSDMIVDIDFSACLLP